MVHHDNQQQKQNKNKRLRTCSECEHIFSRKSKKSAVGEEGKLRLNVVCSFNI